MEENVLKKTCVPVRENETISIEPVCLMWCILHNVFPESDADGGHANCTSWMSSIELLAEIRDQKSESFEDDIMIWGLLDCFRRVEIRK